MLVSRKGLRNQLKSLWRGKSASSTQLATSNNHSAPLPETPGRTGPTTTAGGQAYSTGSMEFQMRMLADVAFLMQDYELAGTTLRLLAADFKSDRAWKHYAGAQVVIPGVVSLLLWLLGVRGCAAGISLIWAFPACKPAAQLCHQAGL